MKNIVCMVSALAAALGLLSGCAARGERMPDDEKTNMTASPMISASPLIVTPNPAQGEIEDGDRNENGTVARPSRSPSGTVSPSPGTGSRG